jgi:hypothetical protein
LEDNLFFGHNTAIQLAAKYLLEVLVWLILRMIMHLIILGGVGVAGTGTATTVSINTQLKPSGKIGPVNRFSNQHC